MRPRHHTLDRRQVHRSATSRLHGLKRTFRPDGTSSCAIAHDKCVFPLPERPKAGTCSRASTKAASRRARTRLGAFEVYWRIDENPQHARACLAEFLVRYNTVSPHWALLPDEGVDPLVPAEVYRCGRNIRIPRWRDWARAARSRLEILLEEVA
jgi:hypothetical protein